MSELVRRRIEDLYSRNSKFGKEDRNEEEVIRYKENFKKELYGIRQDLIGLLREFQELLPSDLPWKKQRLLSFSCYDLNCILTKYGVEDIRHPYNFETVEYIVNGYMYPDKRKFPKEHHPSLGGARFLIQRINELEMLNGFKLEGKYLLNKH